MNETIEPPIRQQLGIKEAALEIGCTEADVRYYLSQGILRYGVQTQLISCVAQISLFDVYQLPQVAQLRHIDKPSPEQAHNTRIKLEELDLSKHEQEPDHHLYVSHSINRLYSDANNKRWATNFFTFEKEPVFLLSKPQYDFVIESGCVGTIVIHEDGIQTLEPAIISREELDRFIQTHQSEYSSAELEPQDNSKHFTNSPFELFIEPPRSDNAAKAICELGNKLWRDPENNRQTITESRLLEYIFSKEQKQYTAKEDSSGVYRIDGTRVTARGFKSRYKTYLKEP